MFDASTKADRKPGKDHTSRLPTGKWLAWARLTAAHGKDKEQAAAYDHLKHGALQR